jgi:DNA-binding PadR family transcriptional regulator
MKKAPTNLGYALLGLLHMAPLSGYDLRKIFASTPMGHYSSSPGAIYPALRRLEQNGLISGEIDDTKTLRPKKVFRPTSQGSEVLREWLERTVTRDDVIWRMDALMLRFSFHSVLDSKSASRSFLIGFDHQVRSYVKELETQRKEFPPEAPLQACLALEAGIEQYLGHARWARKALEHFQEDES